MQPAWPHKTRELQTAVLDSTRWNGFKYRANDVVVDTWAKSGTTWVMQIVAQLLWDTPEEITFGPDRAPWIEMRLPPIAAVLAATEALSHRRLFKSHLPIDALVFSPEAKYIYVGRDVRDVVWSAYNHQAGFTQGALDRFNNTPGRVGAPITHPSCDVLEYYLRFLRDGEMEGLGMAPFWPHVQGWWNIRHLPNVRLVHFNSLKSDMAGEISRIAKFLRVEIAPSQWPKILKHCSFDYMQTTMAQNQAVNGALSMMWKGGAATFIYKGTNGRWKDVLSADQIAKADEVAALNLTPDCARWLKTGEWLED